MNANFYLSRRDQSGCVLTHQDNSKHIYEYCYVETLYPEGKGKIIPVL